MARAAKKLLSCLGLACLLGGCILAPAIDSFQRAGVTAGGRQSRLNQDLRRFFEAMSWGSPLEVTSYLDDEHREVLAKELLKSKREERLVESKLDSVDFSDGSFRATAQVAVRYYRIPFYTVRERMEKQEWRFSMTGGWKLISRELVEQG